MELQIYATRVKMLPGDGSSMEVTLSGVVLTQLLAEINTEEVLQALVDNDHLSDIADFLTKELKDEN